MAPPPAFSRLGARTPRIPPPGAGTVGVPPVHSSFRSFPIDLTHFDYSTPRAAVSSDRHQVFALNRIETGPVSKAERVPTVPSVITG